MNCLKRSSGWSGSIVSSFLKSVHPGAHHHQLLPSQITQNNVVDQQTAGRLSGHTGWQPLQVRNGWVREHQPVKAVGTNNEHNVRKFKKLRASKYLKVDLPDNDMMRKDPSELSPAAMRDYRRKLGMEPFRYDVPFEKPVYQSCSSDLMEKFIPPKQGGSVEDDDNLLEDDSTESNNSSSYIPSKSDLKDLGSKPTRKLKTIRDTRKIRKYDEVFSAKTFPSIAQDVYIKLHTMLAGQQYEDLLELATEHAYPEMVSNVSDKTLYWKFVKSLEPPSVVHVRCFGIRSKEDLFGQVTVRFHTQQIFAVYDRFGRLLHGSPTVAKDVLEYVVYEKHIVNVYGLWRVHAKIIPDWKTPEYSSQIVRKSSTEQKESSQTTDTEKKSESSEGADSDQVPVLGVGDKDDDCRSGISEFKNQKRKSSQI